MYTERKRPLQLQSYMPASRRKLQQSNMGPRINQPVDGIDTRKPLQDLPRATSKLRGVQQVAGMLRNGEEGLQNFVQEKLEMLELSTSMSGRLSTVQSVCF